MITILVSWSEKKVSIDCLHESKSSGAKPKIGPHHTGVSPITTHPALSLQFAFHVSAVDIVQNTFNDMTRWDNHAHRLSAMVPAGYGFTPAGLQLSNYGLYSSLSQFPNFSMALSAIFYLWLSLFAQLAACKVTIVDYYYVVR
eukprot:981403-Prorocentrum_minimum.AAC.1